MMNFGMMGGVGIFRNFFLDNRHRWYRTACSMAESKTA